MAQANPAPVLFQGLDSLVTALEEQRNVESGGGLYPSVSSPDVEDCHCNNHRYHRVRRKSGQGADDSLVVEVALDTSGVRGGRWDLSKF